MNLRRRFTFLVAGALLAPFVTVVLMVMVFGGFPASDRLDSLSDVRSIHRFLTEPISWDEAREIAGRLPSHSAFALLGSEGDVIESRGLVQLLPPEEEGTVRREIVVKPIVGRSSDRPAAGYLVLAGPDTGLGMRVGLAVFVVIFVVFTSSVAIATVRSIKRSLQHLQNATALIAEGSLDFDLAIPETDSFYPLARSLEWMRDRIREEYDRRTRFFMGVSHDLKTPLASITGFSDALLDDLSDDPETQKRYARIIRDKAHLLERRITQLMEYVKLANGEFQTSLEVRDLTSFLEDFIARQIEEAGVLGHNLEARVEIDEPVLVSFDPELLARALENVLTNAYRHGVPDTPVRFRARRAGAEITIACTNEAESLPGADELSRLFDPFYRRDSARSGEGFGLGLASARSIATSHGWSIEAHTPDERTVEFTIRIPITR